MNIEEVDKKLGRHLIADFCACAHLPKKYELQDFLADVREIILEAGASIVGELSHVYDEGTDDNAIAAFSCVWHIGESHISMHSWPEEDNYLAVDVFTCGKVNSRQIVDRLQMVLEPNMNLSRIFEIPRGRNLE